MACKRNEYSTSSIGKNVVGGRYIGGSDIVKVLTR
jgi:hypothetical protein